MSEAEEVLARLGVSRETSERLEGLATLLRKWTPRINLVAKRSVETLWTRHIEDSAQVFRLAPAGARSWVDLGAGGGFPGLVVACLAREQAPQLRVSLVESDGRKCAFLSTAARELGLDVEVQNKRIEALDPVAYDVVSARALASLDRLLELSAPLAGPGTIRLFPKGAGAASELTEARRNWHIECQSHPSVTDPDAVILEIQEVARGPVTRT